MDNFYERKKCIICNENNLETLFDNNKTIPCNPNVIEDNDKSILIEYNIIICKFCGSYQNKFLGNLNIVYKKSHNNVIISKTWETHYKLFSEFVIRKNTVGKKILEIGGGNNYIADLLIKIYKDYSILEPNVKVKNNNIKYIEEWIENFNPNVKYDILILSHVLEHLYDPKEIFKFKSKYIFISVPNLKKYVENMFINVLNIEHTYYFEEKHLIYLFNLNGYKLNSIEYFIDHSMFMFFEKNDIICETINFDEIFKEDVKEKFYLFFEKINFMVNSINNITSNNENKYAVFPCNHYIQYLITFGLKIENINYLFDNSKDKNNKTLYGTNLECKDINFFIGKNIIILLIGSLYNKEITDKFNELNIKYIEFN